MVRLIGEVAALKGGHADKKRMLMDGLCKLIDADSWVWGMCVQMIEGEQPVYVNFTYGGMTEEQFARLVKAAEHPDEGTFLAPFIRDLKRRRQHLTRLRQQTDPEDHFSRSKSRELWIKAGVYPGIYSARPLDDRCLSVIGVYRKPGRPDLTSRESKLAHILLSEVAWLHEQGWPEDRGVTVPHLAPRQRVTLNFLLLGHGRKDIAEMMGISVNTVSGYVKEIYRHFGVQSQAELMRHFLVGDGGDVPG